MTGYACRPIRTTAAALIVGSLAVCPAFADQSIPDAAPFVPEDWSLHAQTTFIEQGDLRFHSPYRGANSLDPAPRGRESWTGTLFLGRRLPWNGGELYFDPEFNQGFGLSRTEGVAGFPNGEAQKGGFDNPKANVARLSVRQSFGFGGARAARCQCQSTRLGRRRGAADRDGREVLADRSLRYQ
jgi:hypothetical protein